MAQSKKQIERKNYILDSFANYYFAHLNPIFQAWKELEEQLELFCSLENEPEKAFSDVQKEILFLVQEKHLISKYPVSNPFKKKVSIWLNEICKRNSWTLDSVFEEWSLIQKGLIDFHISMLWNFKLQEPNYIFKTYTYDDFQLVLLEENRDPIGQGTTGLISWQGAVLLTSWAQTFGNEVFKEGQKVLELGSGLGLFGLAMVASQTIKTEFIFSDCHEKVLQFLHFNVRLNFQQNPEWSNDFYSKCTDEMPNISKSDKYEYKESSISILPLDWTNFKVSDLPQVDIIVGSDLVYSLELIPGLCSLLKSLLTHKDAKVAYIACTHRNGNSIDAFLKELESIGLKCELHYKRVFGINEGVIVHHEPLKPISLFKITA